MANPLELVPRQDSGGHQEEGEELDVSTPVSYFDNYRHDDGQQDAAAHTPACPDPTGSLANSPHVRINTTTTVVRPLPDNEEDDSDSEAKKELPTSPRGRRKFTITFDVCSPEKLPQGVVASPPREVTADGQESEPTHSLPPFPPVAPSDAAAAQKPVPSPQRRVEEEGLGDDWAATPWKEPSVRIAETRRRRALVNQGKMDMRRTGPEDLLFLGPGITLYFHFVRALAICFFLASILHIPHLIISYSGGMVEAYQISEGSAAYFMAASHMVKYPHTNTTSWCEGATVDTIFARDMPCSEPVIRLYGRRSKLYIKGTHASYLIAACDVVSCLLFIATWLWLVWKHESMKKADSVSPILSPDDYAVEVEGLPSDATEAEIVEHFNGLYALNGGQDWTWDGNCWGLVNAKLHMRTPLSIVDIAGRVVGPSLQPVEDPLPAHQQQLQLYKGSWVVQAVVAKPLGTLIRRFRTLEKLSEKLLRQRALAKKYNANTTYLGGKGADPAKFSKAQKKLVQLQDQINLEQLSLKMMAGTLVKMERTCIGAWVIFEHRRSRDRCLYDYRLYSNHRLLFWKPPLPLLFRGTHRLVVTEPPPPSDVLWENQETTLVGEYMRRLVTNGAMLILLVIALFISVTLSSFSRDFVQESGVDGDVCAGLGASLYGLEPASPAIWYHIPPGSDVCPAGEHYLSLLPPPQGLERTDACAQPCFNVLDEAVLNTPQTCAGDGSTTLARGALLKCFCQGVWGQFSSSSSSSSSSSPSSSAAAGQPLDLSYEALQACRFPAYDYFVSQIVSVISSIVTIVTNEIIRFAVPILVDWERHRTASESITRLFIKSLAALFLNTCGLLLLIHLRVKNKALNEFGFFTGSAVDVDLSWYLAIGVSLSNTMFINAFTTQLTFLATELVANPVLRYLQATTTKISQIHLNKLYAPSLFSVHSRMALLMNTLLISLLFNTALPALIPFAAVAFTLAFLVDKYLLLRCYAKPPAYDGRLVRFSINLLPYILALHLFVSVVVMGNTDFFPSALWQRRAIDDALTHTNTGKDLVGRFCLYSTLPLSVLLAFLVLGKFMEFVGRDVSSVVKFVRGTLAPYTQVCCETRTAEAEMEVSDDEEAGPKGSPTQGGVSKKNLRVNIYPPYTRRCEVAYPNRAAVPDFPSESGWEIEGDGEGDTPRSECVKLVKRWTPEELSSSMAPVKAGQGKDGAEAENGRPLFKKTWEVIQEGGGLVTYRIEDNKQYAEVLLVRATLHLSAKSLLGIETHRLDWSRLFTMRELNTHGGTEEEEEDEDDKKEGGKKLAMFRRKRKDKKAHVDGDDKAPPSGS